MRRPGRAFPSDHASSSLQGEPDSPPRHQVPWKRGLAKISIVLCGSLALYYYTWVNMPTFFTTRDSLQSFEFKMYEKFPNAAHSRRQLQSMHEYDEPVAQMWWSLHGSKGAHVSLYYIMVEVGGDHKQFFLDIDTGSSLTWIHCHLTPQLKSPKQGPNGYYEGIKSRTGHPVLCNEASCALVEEYQDPLECNPSNPQLCPYELNYADSLATRGVLFKDTMRLPCGGSRAFDVELQFGCGYEQKGCEYNVTNNSALTLASDGIIGLTRKKISIPSQLYQQRIMRYVVGHCFLPIHKRTTGIVGSLFLGESEKTIKGITWTKMFDRDLKPGTTASTYEGEMQKVKFGKKVLKIFSTEEDERIVVFDSGTSMIWFTKSLYLIVLEHVRTEVLKYNFKPMPKTYRGAYNDIGGTRCWKIPYPLMNQPFSHFKDMTFGFTPYTKQCLTCLPLLKGRYSKFIMPPTSYLHIQGEKLEVLCLAIFPEENATFQTFGGHALQGVLLVMDNELHRIGWRHSEDCN